MARSRGEETQGKAIPLPQCRTLEHRGEKLGPRSLGQTRPAAPHGLSLGSCCRRPRLPPGNLDAEPSAQTRGDARTGPRPARPCASLGTNSSGPTTTLLCCATVPCVTQPQSRGQDVAAVRSNAPPYLPTLSPHLNPKPSHPNLGLPTSHQVLKTCASAPAVIEVLVNSYPQLRVSESWKEVIPEDVFQVRGRPPFLQNRRPLLMREELRADTH